MSTIQKKHSSSFSFGKQLNETYTRPISLGESSNLHFHQSPKDDNNFIIRPFEGKDASAVIDILNYFINNSFAAYPNEQVTDDFIRYLTDITAGYPFYFVESTKNEHVGFAFIRPYDNSNSFDHVAELAFFILPIFSGCGLGTKLLEMLSEDARQMGISILLSSISGINEASLKFHLKNGFEECGRFKQICRKRGKVFDIIWVQKFL